jgi:membrane protein implicated in regulation of membrane protease activity
MWWLIDHVPPWVWIILIIGTTGALWFYFSPIITVVWRLLPNWLKVTLGAVLSLILAVLYGRYKGAKDEREKQAEREADQINKRKQVDESVRNASDADLDKRANRWLRD